MPYETPVLRTLLKEAADTLDPFNNNEHSDLYKKIQMVLKYGAPETKLHGLAEAMATAYETGESRDLNAAVKLYRLQYPAVNIPYKRDNY